MDALLIEADAPFRGGLVRALADVGLATRVAKSGVAGRRQLTRRSLPTVLYLAERLPDIPGGDLLADLGRNPRWNEVPIVVRAELADSVFACALGAVGQLVITRDAGARAVAELLRDQALLCTPADPSWPQHLLDRARELRGRAQDARNRSLELRLRAAKLPAPWRRH